MTPIFPLIDHFFQRFSTISRENEEILSGTEKFEFLENAPSNSKNL